MYHPVAKFYRERLKDLIVFNQECMLRDLYLDLVVEVCGYGVESGVGAVRLPLPVGPLAATCRRALQMQGAGARFNRKHFLTKLGLKFVSSDTKKLLKIVDFDT